MIQILLSTYNGGRYLGPQLESLLSQTCQDWQLLVRDDGSTDDTPGIIGDFAARHPSRVLLVSDSLGNLRPCQSFGKLLERSTSPHVMFCDQDDVWQPQKVESTIQKIKELEARHGQETPLLVHCDLEVVDESLRQISPSMWKYQQIVPKNASNLARQLMMNSVTGCATMVNRALIQKALPLPTDAIMHDWWLGLVASAFGKTGYIPQPLIKYRQHANSSIGAKPPSTMEMLLRQIIQRFRPSEERERMRAEGLRSLEMHLAQERAFHDRFANELSSEDLAVTNASLTLFDWPRFLRVYPQLRYGLLRVGFANNLAIAARSRYVRE